jgi:hypothetical protein
LKRRSGSVGSINAYLRGLTGLEASIGTIGTINEAMDQIKNASPAYQVESSRVIKPKRKIPEANVSTRHDDLVAGT